MAGLDWVWWALPTCFGRHISDGTLEQAKGAGADVTLTTLGNKNHTEDLHRITPGGAHAAVVYTSSDLAYTQAYEVLRLNGLLMFVRIPSEPLKVDVMDMCQGKYSSSRVRKHSAGNGKTIDSIIETLVY